MCVNFLNGIKINSFIMRFQVRKSTTSGADAVATDGVAALPQFTNHELLNKAIYFERPKVTING